MLVALDQYKTKLYSHMGKKMCKNYLGEFKEFSKYSVCFSNLKLGKCHKSCSIWVQVVLKEKVTILLSINMFNKQLIFIKVLR